MSGCLKKGIYRGEMVDFNSLSAVSGYFIFKKTEEIRMRKLSGFEHLTSHWGDYTLLVDLNKLNRKFLRTTLILGGTFGHPWCEEDIPKNAIMGVSFSQPNKEKISKIVSFIVINARKREELIFVYWRGPYIDVVERGYRTVDYWPREQVVRRGDIDMRNQPIKYK